MKKLLSILLVLMLGCTILFAQAATEAKTEEADEIIEGEIPTLHILNYNVSYNMTDCIEYQDIEKATGISATFDVLPAENTDQVLMLTLSMDNDYDCAVIKGNSAFRTLMNSGALLPLNDYIDKYAPELWDLCEEKVWRGVSDEQGNVYCLPATASVKYEINNNMTVRLDLAEKAGLGRELPKTITEFYNYCKALKDFYGDEYTILAAPDNSALSISKCIMSAFGIYNDWMLDENGKVIYMTEHPNYKAMVEFLNKLYNEGILDSEYATNNLTKVNAKLSSGKAIITMNGRGSISSPAKSLLKNFPELTLDDLGFIPFLRADDGSATVMLNDGYSIYTVIPRGAEKNVKYVLEYVKRKVQNQEYCFIGEEGVHFSWDEDGYPVPIQPKFNDERNKSNNYLMMKDNDAWELQFYARLRKTESIWRMFQVCGVDFKNNCQDAWVEAYFSYNNCDEYSKYNANLQSNLKTYNIQLITGVKSLDSSIAEFNKEFQVSGGEEVRAALQKYIDEGK
ncbi:MAG: extracellular solute-binding protein [Spirochaetales bacterium]|nr:extracellular solute-binding protein [Spirochaetales bacterium]